MPPCPLHASSLQSAHRVGLGDGHHVAGLHAAGAKHGGKLDGQAAQLAAGVRGAAAAAQQGGGVIGALQHRGQRLQARRHDG